ncbi:glycosyltransferase family 2 protein, partial [Streptococcus pneumoniae]
LGTIVGLIRGFKWKKEYKGTIIYLDKISQINQNMLQ